jgi:hypothetical protein
MVAEGLEGVYSAVRAPVVDKEKAVGLPGASEGFEGVDGQSLGFIIARNDNDG